MADVSTLLEILVEYVLSLGADPNEKDDVSTLLEILVVHAAAWCGAEVRHYVSTLLEILGLVCLVLVGF